MFDFFAVPRLVLIFTSFGMLSFERVAVCDDRTSHHLIFMLDRSTSIESLGPHNQQTIVNHAFDVSRLTQGRVKVAFIFFGGTVDVVAGDDGLPTAASKPIRDKCEEILRKPCEGGTPLPLALEELNRILDQLSGQHTTVVSLGDGTPSLQLSFDLFPDVKAARDKEVERRLKQGGSEAVDEYLTRLNDANSQEVIHLFKIQQPFVVDRCLQLAKATSSYGVRFVSIAFTSGLADLLAIHEAAGGSPGDYHECDPANAMQTIAAANLVDGLIAFPVIDLPASEKFSFTKAVPLAPELKASSIVTTEISPTPQFLELAVAGYQVNGVASTTSASSDSLSLCHDSESRFCGLSAVAPPADQIVFGYRSQKEELSFPGGKVFRWVELPENLRIVCRPKTIESTLQPPYEVIQQQKDEWLAGIQWIGGEGISMSSGELVFKHNGTGDERLVSLHADASFKKLLTTPVQDLPAGKYSVEVHLTLSSGIPLSTTLQDHFTVVGVEEKLRVAIGDETASIDRVDFGTLGDATLHKDVALLLSSDTPFDLPLRIRVVDLRDAEGNAVGADWISAQDEIAVVPAGQAISVKIRCRLPVSQPDAIVDGLMTAVLEIVNADSLQPVTLLPAVEGLSDEETLHIVQFTLQRPQWIVSAPRGWRDLIIGSDSERTLKANANVAFRYERSLVLSLGTTSTIPREVTVRLSRCHDESGATTESVRLEPDTTFFGSQSTIEPGGVVAFKLPMSIAEAKQRGFGSIVISGTGLKPLLLPFELSSGRENGIWMAYVSLISFIGLLVLSLVWKAKLRRLAPYCCDPSATASKPYGTGKVLDFVSFKPSGEGVCLTPLMPDQQIEIGLDESRPMDSEEYVAFDQGVTVWSPNGRRVAIEGFDSDGETCWARVESGGPLEKTRRSAKRRFAGLSLFASACLLAAAGIRQSSWMIEIVQFTIDILYLS